ALKLGQGAGMQQPLAIAIISGLIVQFPMVLGALPVMLALIERHRGKGEAPAPRQEPLPDRDA
ncbi:hypothetical protein, partial [Acidocella sp.]|uniref:hypothetical protein n=1 Tax=Acidocella sp. TaxID=50710 RepID=UPI0026310E8C